MVQNKFFEEVKKSLNDAIGEEIDEKLIEIPPDSKLGDYAFPCFSLAKKFKKAPQMIATELKDKIKFNENLISEIKTIGPYINFFINKKEFSKNILNEINDKKEKYASEDNKDYTVMIESPGPNTNKPLHLGHVRNMLLGNSIQNIYNFLGYKTVHVDIVNNRGVHICKSMLAYHKFGNNSEPDKKPDHFVGDYYVKYAKAEKEHPEMEEEIQEMLKKWEENDPETRALWQKMNDWCLVGMKTTYDRYGVKMDKPYYESEHYVKGRDIALNALKNGIFEKNEKGDIIVDFEKEKLGKKVILRANGTSVYMTQDLVLAKLRYEDYEMDKLIYIVGAPQSYHFQVLFKIFEKLDFHFAKDCFHLAYGMVKLPDGKMKSREGNVVDADNLADDMHFVSKKEIQKRHPEIDEKELEKRAESIGMGAIKFFVLKFDAMKDFVFNPKESLSFEGETGPYVQYTYARISSILRKYGKEVTEEINFNNLNDSFDIVKLMSRLNETVKKSAEDHKPSYICRYLLDLCKLFNEYYHNNKILQDDKELEKARIHLIKQIQTILGIGMNLIGMQPIEEM